MSLSHRQVNLIQSSFSKVEPIADQAAEIFYDKLFGYDPNLRRLFKNDMKSQGRKLMATLKVAVKGLDNTEALVPILENLAIGHLKYGVKEEHYTFVGNALMNRTRRRVDPRTQTSLGRLHSTGCQRNENKSLPLTRQQTHQTKTPNPPASITSQA